MALRKRIFEDKIEVVVICRGGGSLEDLWAFNNEKLCLKVSDYPLPVVSAIGHQTDFSILDFVSDLRVETPSAAAELLTQKNFELLNHLNNLDVSFIPFDEITPKNLEEKVAIDVTKIARTILIDI